jgi:hypothetical protein
MFLYLEGVSQERIKAMLIEKKGRDEPCEGKNHNLVLDGLWEQRRSEA